MKIKTSIVVVNYNTKEITLKCINSILKSTKGIGFEILLVDNASTDGSQAAFRQFSQKHKDVKLILNSKNHGFSKGNNVGIEKAKGEYILLLNSDTLVNSNLVSEMSIYMDNHTDVGICSCKLLNEDGSVQGTGGYFPNLVRVISWMTIEDIPGVEKIIKPFHPHRAKSFYKNDSFFKTKREVDWLTGAFLFIRRKAIDEVGFLDEEYFMYTEDTDFCFRAKKAGWKILYLPKWSIVHLGGKSSEREFPILSEFKNIKLFYKKHYPSWQFPIVRFFLKLGAGLRMIAFGILQRREAVDTYAKAFREI